MPLPFSGLIKLSEECGELVQAAMKRITCNKETHWDGSNLNERLADEIADVTAAMDVVINELDLDVDRINDRADRKRKLFEYWLDGGESTTLQEGK
jgi:NTP pyrophosphatase (non-canonical NTP hydrolase)